jgi:hypothetical protein
MEPRCGGASESSGSRGKPTWATPFGLASGDGLISFTRFKLFDKGATLLTYPYSLQKVFLPI